MMLARVMKTVDATHKMVCGIAAELREMKGRQSGKALPALPVQSREELDMLNKALADEKMYDLLVIILLFYSVLHF